MEEWRYREILTNFVKHAYKKALDNGVEYDAIKTRLELENECGSAFLPVFDKRHDHVLDKWRAKVVDVFTTQATKNLNPSWFDAIEDQLRIACVELETKYDKLFLPQFDFDVEEIENSSHHLMCRKYKKKGKQVRGANCKQQT